MQVACRTKQCGTWEAIWVRRNQFSAGQSGKGPPKIAWRNGGGGGRMVPVAQRMKTLSSLLHGPLGDRLLLDWASGRLPSSCLLSRKDLS